MKTGSRIHIMQPGLVQYYNALGLVLQKLQLQNVRKIWKNSETSFEQCLIIIVWGEIVKKNYSSESVET